MDHYWKMMSRNDTMKISQKSHFKKIENDSVIPFLFNSDLHSPELGEIKLLYTGDQLLMYSGKSGVITHRKNNGTNVWMIYNKNIAFNPYLPLTYRNSKPIPGPEALKSGKFAPSYVKQERINGMLCDQINAVVSEEFDHSTLKGTGYILKTEYNYWISRKDSIPVQITVSRNLKAGKDTLLEFEKFILNKYELNWLPQDTSLFALHAVPSTVNLVPADFSREENLQIGAIAPDWQLPTIKGDTVSLADFKGDLILLDFFIASCPPCVKILPDLHSLHKKYKGKGLHVIGLDEMDSHKTVNDFVSRHNIDYPVLLNSYSVLKAYQVSSYPTLYLIGRDGKILFHLNGYERAALVQLEHTIRQQLK